MKYFSKYRVCWFALILFQILCGAAVFLPAVEIVAVSADLETYESVSRSVVWYLSEAGFPEIYNTVLFLYAALSLPLVVLGFRRKLCRFPLLVAAVTDILFALINALWIGFVLMLGISGDFSSAASLTPWCYIYMAVQIAQIVCLFVLFFKMKKTLTI